MRGDSRYKIYYVSTRLNVAALCNLEENLEEAESSDKMLKSLYYFFM